MPKLVEIVLVYGSVNRKLSPPTGWRRRQLVINVRMVTLQHSTDQPFQHAVAFLLRWGRRRVIRRRCVVCPFDRPIWGCFRCWTTRGCWGRCWRVERVASKGKNGDWSRDKGFVAGKRIVINAKGIRRDGRKRRQDELGEDEESANGGLDVEGGSCWRWAVSCLIIWDCFILANIYPHSCCHGLAHQALGLRSLGFHRTGGTAGFLFKEFWIDAHSFLFLRFIS